MRLTTGAQAVLDRRLRDLQLVQHALTDRMVEADQAGNSNLATFLDVEADAIRQALSEIRAVLRVAGQEN